MEDFEVPLSSPFTWKPTKICKLWNDFHNLIKHQFENGERITEQEILEFRERIKVAAIKNEVLGPNDNWKDILGEYHFELVTRSEVNVQSWWEASVVSLLRVIRNKHQHRDGFSDAERIDLGWCQKRKWKLKFDEKLFASYWISRFPNLVPFLWSQFGHYRTSFREYYPASLANDLDRLNFGLGEFVTQLEQACCNQLNNGFVEDRFICTNPSCSIELRTLSGDVLGRVLDGSSISRIVLSAKTLTVIWDGNPRSVMEYKCSGSLNNFKRNINGGKDENIIFIFTSGSDELDENSIFTPYSKDTFNIIVIFTTKDAVDVIVKKFASNIASFHTNPIKWIDLSELKRKEIESCDDFVFSVQSSNFLAKEVLQNDKINRESLLETLEGRQLNDFLRNNKLPVLTTYEIPTVDEFYRERRLYNLEKLHYMVFENPNQNEVFIIIRNASERQPPVPINVTIAQMDSIFPEFNLTSQVNIVTVADSKKEYLSECLRTFQVWKEGSITKSIHFFRYLSDENFKWVTTYGSVASVESQFVKAAKKSGIMSESKFLSSLKSHKSKKQLVFIADQPGMGKSQVLINLATQMRRNAKGKIILFFSICEFVDTFRTNCAKNCTDDTSRTLKTIIKTITDLTCSGKFEEALIGSLLRECSSTIKFEILLDGLDEVKSEFRDVATNILQTFHSNTTLPVRVWVTMRDHMLDYIKTEFNTLGYKLDPLSENEQVRLLTDLWSKKCEIQSKNSRTCERLRQFARKCIENCLSSGDAELAGIPLQCRMIAEVYEGQVLDLNFGIDKIARFDLIDLYEKLMERKMEVYIREKKMIPEHIKSDDCLVQIIFNSLNQYLQYLSIQLIFSKEVAEMFKDTFSIPGGTQLTLRKAFTTMVLEHGIVQDLSPLKFIHRTFAEYLVARFVTNFLHDFLSDHDNLDDLHPEFQEFLWNNVLAVKIEKSNWTFKHPTLCQFLDNFLKRIVIENEQSQSIRKNGYFLRTWDFLDLVYKMKSVRWSGNLRCASLFFAAAGNWRFTRMDSLENIIWITIQSRLRLTGLFILTLQTEQLDTAKYLIENLDCGPEHWHHVQKYDKSRLGILHYFFSLFNQFYKDRLPEHAVKDFIKYLLEIEPNLINERDAMGRTPLLFLVNSVLPFSQSDWKGDRQQLLEILKLLVDSGADIHDTDDNGNTVLHLGKYYDAPDLPITSRMNGDTLTYLIEKGVYFQVLQFFLENGCGRWELNCFNSNGCTPLLSILDILSYYYKEMSLFCYFGLSCEHILKILIYLLHLFLSYGMNLNACDWDGKTVICKIVEKEFSLCFVKKFVEYGANILAAYGKSQNAFQVAVEMGAIHLVKYMINALPFCLYIKDIIGKHAVERQSTRIVRKYIEYKLNAEMSDYVGCSYSCI